MLCQVRRENPHAAASLILRTLVADGRTQPVRIHALLDDATRYVLAIDAFPSEEEACMLQLWVRALRRYGAPQTLYLDNGSTYRGQALRLAASAWAPRWCTPSPTMRPHAARWSASGVRCARAASTTWAR